MWRRRAAAVVELAFGTDQEVAQDSGRTPDQTIRPALDLALLLVEDLWWSRDDSQLPTRNLRPSRHVPTGRAGGRGWRKGGNSRI